MLLPYLTTNWQRSLMDWNQAIARNLAALLHIADVLCAMAGLDADAAPGANRASWPTSLPRHLHTAVLGVLRPAEAALRRLIVIAARDLVVTLSPAERDRIAKSALPAPTSRTGIFLNGRPAHPEDLARARHTQNMNSSPANGGQSKARAARFCLFDPLKRFGAQRRGRPQAIPRIRFDLDAASPPNQPARQKTSPDDPISAARLSHRLAALQTALDDLPGQAQRLARWRARRLLRRGRPGRLSPMRPGSPPGHRSHGTHPVDEVLHHCHGLAVDIAMRNDTS